MGSGDTDLTLNPSLFCSICLEAVTDDGTRSTAKLQCGHEYHLDCIGSAFNAKGAMQCPNCRKIEKGQWLYANGHRSETGIDDWTHEEDFYDLTYSELPFRVHWCPFSGLTRLTSSFEEGESPSTAYHDLLGHHAMMSEHTAASSATHPCPYVTYIQPLQPLQPSLSSNSTEAVVEGPSFHHHWSGLSGPSDISTSHVFPVIDIQYHSWEHHSPFSSMNGADQASFSSTMRSTRADAGGLPRAAASFLHPFHLGHGSGPRAGNSVISPMVPHFPSNSRTHSRVHGPHTYHQQPIFSGGRRSSSQRSSAPVVTAPSPSDNASFYPFPLPSSSGRNLQEAENSISNRFYAWERDRFAPYPLIPVDRDSNWWGPFHQASGGSDSGNRTGFWHRPEHGSERTSSQGRAENASHQPAHITRTHRFI
eukprot:TRINITY_DN2445_c0_g2_i1.p1 TRINITY_DN2445_c0_g2~~TRINITY_DN2445_c0_g2_i1.p1  ORF type:complete len:421 (+),score=29.28 TRINITY_DN2445_c0_g2_i1:235-1497(+)